MTDKIPTTGPNFDELVKSFTGGRNTSYAIVELESDEPIVIEATMKKAVEAMRLEKSIRLHEKLLDKAEGELITLKQCIESEKSILAKLKRDLSEIKVGYNITCRRMEKEK